MTTPTPVPPAVVPPSAPQVAVSLHAWDSYYVNPGGREVMTEVFRAHLDALAQLNVLAPATVTRVRVDMGWSASQPSASPPDADYYYNRRFLRLFEELAARGLAPYVVVHQSPRWARPVGADAKHLPSDPHDIAPWAAWFAATYGRWVREVEVWNEPNLEAFAGRGCATAARYVPVLAAFREALLSVKSTMQVIGGNVSQCDWVWLRQAYDLGFGEHCDIVGVHPYQGNQAVHPASTSTSGLAKTAAGWEKGRITVGLPKISGLMDVYGDGYKPLWATEVGWSASRTGVGPVGVGAGRQWPTLEDKAADYTVGLLELLATGRTEGVADECAYRQVRLATVYEAYDPASSDPHQKGFEIFARDGALKPQARALAAFRRRFPRLRPLW